MSDPHVFLNHFISHHAQAVRDYVNRYAVYGNIVRERHGDYVWSWHLRETQGARFDRFDQLENEPLFFTTWVTDTDESKTLLRLQAKMAWGPDGFASFREVRWSVEPSELTLMKVMLVF